MYLTVAFVACVITAASILTLFYALSRISKLESAIERLATNLSPENTPATSTRRRRWLTFRMSTLLAVTAFIACLMAAFASELAGSNRQAKAVDQLQQVGAVVDIWDSLPTDSQDSMCGFTLASEEDTPPTWIRYALGKQFGCRTYRVDLNLQGAGSDSIDLGPLQCGDEDLVSLKDLRGLRDLVLDHTNITDAGLSHVGLATSLRSLSLRNTSIDGSGFHHLRALKDLHHLDLRGTNFQQKHLQELQQHSNLQSICLPRQANSDWLESLAKIHSLKAIDFDKTNVSHTGLEPLRKLPQLTCLVLNKNCTNANFLNQLHSFQSLRVLRLGSDDLTPEDISAIAGLKQVRDLDFGDYFFLCDDEKVSALLSSMHQLSFLRINHGDTVGSFGSGAEAIGFELPDGQILPSLQRTPNQFGGGGFF